MTLFSLPEPYEYEPRRMPARRSDPETSHAAARSITPGRTETLIRLTLAEYGPLTADEICARLPRQYPATVKSAIARAGLVDSGERRPSTRGRAAIVWKLNQQGGQ